MHDTNYMGSVEVVFKPKMVCIFTRRTPMDQLKRKEIKEEEVVCSFMDTETGEVIKTNLISDTN